MSEIFSKALVLRILSALVLAPLVLVLVHFGGPFFDVLIVSMAVILVWEWATMVGRRPLWVALGLVYVGLSALALWSIRQDGEWGQVMVFWVLAIVWGADTGGYAFGKNIGGPKLAPSISPNKTWSGFVGGTLLGAGAGWGVVSYFRPDDALDSVGVSVLFVSAAFAVVSQVGDLLESWVKRRFDVKDSGTIIPGHGGLFDRVDGLVATAIALALVNIALQGNVLKWLS